MDEVEYSEIQRWGWDCPKCGHWNETENDPADQKTVFCEGGSGRTTCGEEYTPVPG